MARPKTDPPAPAQSIFAVKQSATFRMRIGQRGGMSARVVVTPADRLAIGGLVSAILLSIPPIIRAAGEARRAGGD